MKKFGIIAAMAVEMDRVLKVFGENYKIEKKGGIDVYIFEGEKTIFVVKSGIGEIAAAAATQLLISCYDVDVILNYGFVGSLKENLRCCDILLCDKVVHYEFDTSPIDNIPAGRYLEFDDVIIKCDQLIDKVERIIPGIKRATIASADKFVADSAIKDMLVSKYNADICDMESAGIIITAKRNNVPAICFKVVSDHADEHSPLSFSEIAYSGSIACADIIEKLIEKL